MYKPHCFFVASLNLVTVVTNDARLDTHASVTIAPHRLNQYTAQVLGAVPLDFSCSAAHTGSKTNAQTKPYRLAGRYTSVCHIGQRTHKVLTVAFQKYISISTWSAKQSPVPPGFPSSGLLHDCPWIVSPCSYLRPAAVSAYLSAQLARPPCQLSWKQEYLATRVGGRGTLLGQRSVAPTLSCNAQIWLPLPLLRHCYPQ